MNVIKSAISNQQRIRVEYITVGYYISIVGSIFNYFDFGIYRREDKKKHICIKYVIKEGTLFKEGYDIRYLFLFCWFVCLFVFFVFFLFIALVRCFPMFSFPYYFFYREQRCDTVISYQGKRRALFMGIVGEKKHSFCFKE